MRPRDWAAAPLTPVQQSIALACREAVDQEVSRVPAALRRAFGREEFEQEAWLAVCRAVVDYDGSSPVTAWVRLPVRGRLADLVAHYARRRRLYRVPLAVDRAAPPAEPPPLAVWCAARGRRRAVAWRVRVALYLRAVEGWSYPEVGAALGVSYQAVQQWFSGLPVAALAGVG